MNKIDDLIADFSMLRSWNERYAQLIAMGDDLPDFPSQLQRPEFLVKGCMSHVWIVLHNLNGKLDIQADSDAAIVKGLIALVVAVYQGQELSEIKNINIKDCFEKLGLASHLSPNRRNGFFAMIEKIRNFADASY